MSGIGGRAPVAPHRPLVGGLLPEPFFLPRRPRPLPRRGRRDRHLDHPAGRGDRGWPARFGRRGGPDPVASYSATAGGAVLLSAARRRSPWLESLARKLHLYEMHEDAAGNERVVEIAEPNSTGRRSAIPAPRRRPSSRSPSEWPRARRRRGRAVRKRQDQPDPAAAPDVRADRGRDPVDGVPLSDISRHIARGSPSCRRTRGFRGAPSPTPSVLPPGAPTGGRREGRDRGPRPRLRCTLPLGYPRRSAPSEGFSGVSATSSIARALLGSPQLLILTSRRARWTASPRPLSWRRWRRSRGT